MKYLLIIVLVILLSSTIAITLLNTNSLKSSARIVSNQSQTHVVEENNVSWRGIEALEWSYSRYVARVREISGFSGYIKFDAIWPYEGVDDIFAEIVRKTPALIVIIGRVTSIESIETTDSTNIFGTVLVKYSVRVERVIINKLIGLNIATELDRLKPECEKDPTLCEGVQEYLESMKNIGQSIRENTDINVYVSAYVAIDSLTKALNREKLTIADVASPFPLLDTGNVYVLFLEITSSGKAIVLQDIVYGLYAFLVKDGKVYSLNLVTYSVNLDCIRFYADSSEISFPWNSKNYRELREEALSKLIINGENLEQFIDRLKSYER